MTTDAIRDKMIQIMRELAVFETMYGVPTVNRLHEALDDMVEHLGITDIRTDEDEFRASNHMMPVHVSEEAAAEEDAA